MAEIAASGRGAGGKVGGAAGNVTAPGPFAYDEISKQTFEANEVSSTHRGGGKGGPQEIRGWRQRKATIGCQARLKLDSISV